MSSAIAVAHQHLATSIGDGKPSTSSVVTSGSWPQYGQGYR